MNRRDFMKTSMAGAAAIAIPSGMQAHAAPLELPAAEEKSGKNSTIKKEVDDDKFKISMAGYTFVKFDIDTTLAFLKKLDVHYLCIKDFHLPLDSNEQKIAEFKAKLKAADVTGYGVGPIYMKNEQEVDRAFAYAKRVGVDLIVAVPGYLDDQKVPHYDILDYVEKKIQEYNFRVAIHLHGPDMNLYPDATEIWNNVKDRDPRLGMCLDIGHNLRFGSDSLKDLQRYKSRVFDIHLKDVTGPNKTGHAIELGRGIIDFPKFMKVLRKTGYSGAVSLEYEKNMSDSFNEIAESIGYFRGVQYATKV